MPEPDPGDLEPITLHPRMVQALDRVLALQRPVVLAHIRSIRARRPTASPAEIIASLERRYLGAVTGGGAAVGATSAIPAVGTAASLAISGAETLGFLEASALFAQSVTEVHGIAVTDPERARTLVMAMMLGTGGQDLVRQLAGQAAGGETRTRFWGELVGRQLPRVAVDRIGEKIRHAFLRRFAVTQGGTLVGRALPFGIGAVVGGAGNHLLGRKVVQSARSAFGPAPETFPEELAVALRITRIRIRAGMPEALRALPRRLPLRPRASEPPAEAPERSAAEG